MGTNRAPRLTTRSPGARTPSRPGDPNVTLASYRQRDARPLSDPLLPPYVWNEAKECQRRRDFPDVTIGHTVRERCFVRDVAPVPPLVSS